MIYQVGRQSYYVVSQLFSGKANDVYVCRGIGDREETLYTLWEVKDRSIAKVLMKLLPRQTEDCDYLGETVRKSFSCFLFRYRPERSVLRHFQGETRTMTECEELALKLVSECIALQWIPYPVLCLILAQGQVSVEQDNSVYFTYVLNLEDLKETDGKRECAAACASLLSKLLEQKKEAEESVKLIRMKADRAVYPNFYEVCHDIRLLNRPRSRRGRFEKIRRWAVKEKEKLKKLLMVVCILVMLYAIAVLLSQAFTGDVALFRIFHHTFDVIGTETLK